MRAIDADAIEYTHAVARNLFDGHNWNELVVTKDEIEDMPTIQPEITDVKEWIKNQTKFLLTENWGEDSYFTMILKGSECRINEDSFSFWQPCFSLELFNDDYEIFIDKDFDFSFLKYPIYYIFIRNKDNSINLKGSNITIEVI